MPLGWACPLSSHLLRQFQTKHTMYIRMMCSDTKRFGKSNVLYWTNFKEPHTLAAARQTLVLQKKQPRLPIHFTNDSRSTLHRLYISKTCMYIRVRTIRMISLLYHEKIGHRAGTVLSVVSYTYPTCACTRYDKWSAGTGKYIILCWYVHVKAPDYWNGYHKWLSIRSEGDRVGVVLSTLCYLNMHHLSNL